MLAFILAATLTTTPLAHYEASEAEHLVPMLLEVLRFQTDQYTPEAHVAQKAWLKQASADLGFEFRDAGKVTEIELPGPVNAPVLGLVIHGDVQPADAEAWSFPPFSPKVENGYVLGRGAADDKGPLVQALLAMKALKESGVERTHTVRLLVGSEEESAAEEMPEYLKDHAAPDYSLVLDSEFPVVVGEKAWDGLAVTAPLASRKGVSKPYEVESLDAGLSPSIVPDRAELRLRWTGSSAKWEPLIRRLQSVKLPEGTRLATSADGATLRIVAYGKSAHAGVNLAGGRNALVALAQAVKGLLPSGGPDDLLAFVRQAGQDVYGTGLGITGRDPVWGRYAVNIATVKPKEDDPKTLVLFINLRRTPPRNAEQAKSHLATFVSDYAKRTGSTIAFAPELSFFGDEPLGFDTNAKIVRRLMKIYEASTRERVRPAISGGGTYAKRIPNAIAFGMWFPGKPYPGHDVDEKIPIDDLQRGARVLVEALTDIATGPKIEKPFER